MKRIILILMVIPILTGISLAQNPIQEGSIVNRILERERVICGINGSLPYFSNTEDSIVGYAGFDVEICRAVATAILGNPDAIQLVEVVAAERESHVQDAIVDLMVRNTTFNYERDTTWNATFGPITYYDAQDVLVRSGSDINTVQDLVGRNICVAPGTTTVENIAEALSDNVTFFPDSADEEIGETDAFELFISSDTPCDAFTSDASQITAQLFGLPQEERPNYRLLGVRISEEPLAPVSNDGDQQFADIVRVVVFGMITAEYLGINQANVTSFVDSIENDEQTDPIILRFLGFQPTEDEQPIGEQFGLRADFMLNVIQSVGNYGDIYNRHLGDILPRIGTPNQLWVDGGLIYAPPWR